MQSVFKGSDNSVRCSTGYAYLYLVHSWETCYYTNVGRMHMQANREGDEMTVFSQTERMYVYPFHSFQGAVKLRDGVSMRSKFGVP